MTPDSPTEFLQEGAALLFQTFYASETVTHAHTVSLRRLFGPFPASSATKACNHVQKIVSWIPDEDLEELVSVKKDHKSSKHAEFGQSIKFTPSEPATESYDWLDSDDEDLDFDLRYQEEEIDPSAGDNTISPAWLRRKVETHFGKNPEVTKISTFWFN